MTVLKELSELIQACKDIKKRQTHKSWVHVDDIAATLQKIIDDEFARAKRTFNEVVIDEVIEDNDPKPAKAWRIEGNEWEEWGQELAQLRAAHIKNVNNDKGNA